MATQDPFAGSGTTGTVAEELGRNSILVELNPVYVAMQRGRDAFHKVLTAPQEIEKEPGKGWLF